MQLNRVRHIVQCLILAVFLSPLVAKAFWGITPGDWVFFGTLSSSTILGKVVIVDPFVAAQSIAASKQLPAISLVVGSLTILVVYLLIRGRVFCGWVCPANLIFEIVESVAKPVRTYMMKHRGRRLDLAAQLSRRTKIFVALGVLGVSALSGVPVFELISPVGALLRTLVLGAFLGIWVLAALVVLEIFFPGRIWCRKLCPLGGFYELIGRLGFFSVKIKSGCISCDKCKVVCLSSPDILDPVIAGDDDRVRSGDCMLCGKCITACPSKLLSIKACVPFHHPSTIHKEALNK